MIHVKSMKIFWFLKNFYKAVNLGLTEMTSKQNCELKENIKCSN